ncbi:MAG: enoyl-CoA hydratase/isomerase family protein [Methylobacteriaceae bacterium]|nr:enoyl-CoA hydratase/isomerase family protein [Methylobacteriaceae bacterium]
MTSDVVVTRDGNILRIAMNRPAKKNALTGAMYKAMQDALELADRDDDIRALLLTGSDGVFTAGNDIGDFLAGTRDAHGSPALRFITAIALCDTPIVAAVEGNAVGVGTTMLFHCDLVYAAPSAKFRMPFIDLGLVPEAAASLMVPLRVGMAKASEWLLLGEAFDAEEAYRVGVVNKVVPPGELIEVALDAAMRLAAKPKQALAATRRLMRGDRQAIRAQIAAESKEFAAALESPEAKAAFSAFLAKAKG